MTFERTTTCAKRVVWSRAVCMAGASVALALTLGASGHALAQCVGTFSSNSGAGVHSTPSPGAGVHSATSAPSAHSGTSSCSTGGSATRTQAIHLNMAHLNPVAGKPAFVGARHVPATQQATAHSVKSSSAAVKR